MAPARLREYEVGAGAAAPLVRVIAPPAVARALEARLARAGPPPCRLVAIDPASPRFAEEAAGAAASIVHVDGDQDPAQAVRWRSVPHDIPVVVVGWWLTPERARAAIEAGASDAVSLLSIHDSLSVAIVKALGEHGRLERGRRTTRDLANALERARGECSAARAAATTDCVTGLHNKRYFEERLEEEEAKADRSGKPCALVLIDLDHFKSVNDGHGHTTGDRVLREVAATIRRCVRNYDVACRYGGEEFALSMPATTAEQARHVAERIRVDIKTHRFEEAPGLRVTASLAVADFPCPGISNREELFRAADRALYRAKTAGRDRTLVAGEDPRPRPGSGRTSDSGRLALAGATAAAIAEVDALLHAIRGLSLEVTTACFKAVEALAAGPAAGTAAGDPRVFALSSAIAGHAVKIATALDLGAARVEHVRRAALLQDLGMVPIAAGLKHEGGLLDAERELVKQHPAVSTRLAAEMRFLDEELPFILHHHEHFDGSGYPRGLRGERIPLGSRILAVATAYEAMTETRPWRGPREPAQALAEIESLAGSRYDPAVVKAFRRAMAQGAGLPA